MSAGGFHTCALRSDGVVECWGDSFDGQAPPTRYAPTGVYFRQVSAGDLHTCALRSDGVVECWGWNGDGQAPPTQSTTTGGHFFYVSAGGHHTCALNGYGVAECWGDNSFGEAPPARRAATGSFIQMAAGDLHTCALRDDGAVECWGINDYGQAPTTPIFTTGGFLHVSAGGKHTCALGSDWGVKCWGAGATNTGTIPDFGQAPATQSATTGHFTEPVSAGAFHSCALRSDGAVECWGDNTYGQAPATRTASPTITHVLPTATFTFPASVVAGTAFQLSLTNAQVPGHPEATSFTFAFDCGDGVGYGAFGSSNTDSCPASAVGTGTVGGKVKDQDGDTQEYTGIVNLYLPMDIKPQTCPNPLNRTAKGPLQVAILGTATFDVKTVDLTSVKLIDVSPLGYKVADVATPWPGTPMSPSDCTTAGPDGFTDLVLTFDNRVVGSHLVTLPKGAAQSLTLTGNLKPALGARPITGQDVVVIVK